MKKRYIIAILAIASVVTFLYLSLYPKSTDKEAIVAFNRKTVVIHTESGDRSYSTEIAETDKQLARGLMYRESIGENEGMLFIFSKPDRINMWMKNTLIPLDMLFIDSTGKIVYIAHETEPKSLRMINAGNIPVISVMELKGGITKKHNINIGDKVYYKVFTQ